ncbi:amidohydrolase family protein [Streptomyces nogalater]
MLTSGRPITVTGGHCHWFSHECDSPTDIRVAVRTQVRDGADWIKLMVSGGNLTPRTNPVRPQFSEEEVRACVDESDRLGRPVATHAYDPLSIRRAAAAGARTIEHCLFETADGIAYDPATADLMAARSIAFVPTISGALHRMRDGTGLIAPGSGTGTSVSARSSGCCSPPECPWSRARTRASRTAPSTASRRTWPPWWGRTASD